MTAIAILIALGGVSAAAEPAFDPDGERTDHRDGSADVSVWLESQAIADAKFGADFNLQPEQRVTPSRAVSPAADRANAAWLRMPLASGGRVAGYEEAALELRVESGGDESTIAASGRRVLVARPGISLSFAQSASLTRSVEIEDEDEDGEPIPVPLRTVSTSFDTGHELKLELATGTAFSVSASLAPDALVPQPVYGAEQKLFGGVTLNASFGHDDDGNAEASLGASFKQSW